jgi:hypothetical protein
MSECSCFWDTIGVYMLAFVGGWLIGHRGEPVEQFLGLIYLIVAFGFLTGRAVGVIT